MRLIYFTILTLVSSQAFACELNNLANYAGKFKDNTHNYLINVLNHSISNFSTNDPNICLEHNSWYENFVTNYANKVSDYDNQLDVCSNNLAISKSLVNRINEIFDDSNLNIYKLDKIVNAFKYQQKADAIKEYEQNYKYNPNGRQFAPNNFNTSIKKRQLVTRGNKNQVKPGNNIYVFVNDNGKLYITDDIRVDVYKKIHFGDSKLISHSVEFSRLGKNDPLCPSNKFSYIKFASSPFADAGTLNQMINSVYDSKYQKFINNPEYAASMLEKTTKQDDDLFKHNINANIEYISKNLFSFSIDDFIEQKGNKKMVTKKLYTFLIPSKEPISLVQLINLNKSKDFVKACKEEFTKVINKKYNKELSFFKFNEDKLPTGTNFNDDSGFFLPENFYLTNKAIHFSYPPYEQALNGLEELSFMLPIETLKRYMKKEYLNITAN